MKIASAAQMRFLDRCAIENLTSPKRFSWKMRGLRRLILYVGSNRL